MLLQKIITHIDSHSDRTRAGVIHLLRFLFVVCLLLTGFSMPGCMSSRDRETDQAGSTELKGSEIYSSGELSQLLREDLEYFQSRLEPTMSEVLKRLDARDPDDEVRSAFKKWQEAQSIRLALALSKDDPVAALLDVWAEAESLLDLLERGEGVAGLQGDAYNLALKTIKGRRDKLDALAHTYLPPATYRDIYSQIEKYTETNPLSEQNLMPAPEATDKESFSLWSFGQGAVGSIVRLTFLPGRLAGGVAEGGMALGEIRSTTAEAIRVADELPRRIREEIEVLLSTLDEQHDEIMELLTTTEAITSHTQTTAEQAQQTAAQIDKSLETARKALPMLNETAQSIETAAATSKQLTEAVNELMQQLAEQRPPEGDDREGKKFDIIEYKQTAEAINESAREVRDVLVEIRQFAKRGDDQPPPGGKSSFQISEYREAATALQGGAAELRELLVELRELTADDEFSGTLKTAVEQIEQSADQIASRSEQAIDHAAWRALQIISVFFLFLVVYAWLRLRILPPRREKNPGKGSTS